MTEATTAAFEARRAGAPRRPRAAPPFRPPPPPPRCPPPRHFLDALPPAALVLDAGTGNGKYLGARSVLDYTGKHDPPPTRRRRAQESETPASKNDMLAIGFDMSIGLLSIASERGHEVVRGDCVDLSCWRRGAFVRFHLPSPSPSLSLTTFPTGPRHLDRDDPPLCHARTQDRIHQSRSLSPRSCPQKLTTPRRAQQMILAVLPPTPPPVDRPRRSPSRILIVVWSLGENAPPPPGRPPGGPRPAACPRAQPPPLGAPDRPARRTRGGKQGAVPAPLASGGSAASSGGDDEARRTLEGEEGAAIVEVQDVFVPWARQNQIPRRQQKASGGVSSSTGASSSSSGASASASASAKKQQPVLPKRSEKRDQSPSSSKGAALQKVPSSATGAATEPSDKPDNAAEAAAAAVTASPAPAPAAAEAGGNSEETATTSTTAGTETETAPTFNRYYHLFRHYELSSLVQSAASQLGLAFSHPDGYPLPSSKPSSSEEEAKDTKNGEGEWEASVRLCEERWERENWVVEVEVGWSLELGESDQGHRHGHAGGAAPPPEVVSTSASAE